MKRASILLLLAIVILGCAQHSTPTSKPTPTGGKTVVIYGSGATFPLPQMQKWIADFEKTHPNVRVEYVGKGSGGGQNDFKQGLVEFACSDPPVSKGMWLQLEKRGQPLQFPMILGAVVVAYNVPGVKHLKLDGKTIADIFMGKIVYWDDPEIKAQNPYVDLPHKKIIVIHRADSSGTTKIFTTYLCLVSEEFKEKVGSGKLVNWPVDKTGRGLAGEGNPGVVAILKQTSYSIAYTELAYALKEHLNIVAIKNRDGYYVLPNDTTIKDAFRAVKAFVPPPDKGYEENVSQFLNAPGKDAYPLVAFSHALVWKHYANPSVAKAVKEFWTWVLTEGQKKEHIVQGYVSLPKDVAEIGLKAVQQIS